MDGIIWFNVYNEFKKTSLEDIEENAKLVDVQRQWAIEEPLQKIMDQVNGEVKLSKEKLALIDFAFAQVEEILTDTLILVRHPKISL